VPKSACSRSRSQHEDFQQLSQGKSTRKIWDSPWTHRGSLAKENAEDNRATWRKSPRGFRWCKQMMKLHKTRRSPVKIKSDLRKITEKTTWNRGSQLGCETDWVTVWPTQFQMVIDNLVVSLTKYESMWSNQGICCPNRRTCWAENWRFLAANQPISAASTP
jgi:hypothetical protein